MAASAALSRHWRSAPDAELRRALGHARRSVQAFADASAAAGSLLQGWIQGRALRQYEHQPPDDVVDRRRGSQFYYHSHRDGASEHGHLHLFWHATATARRRPWRPGQARWVRTAPTHLLAISLDARGLPTGLFTVNRWVTGGYWFDAATTLALVDRFALGEVGEHALSCRWLTSFVRFYRPLIALLLDARDRRLARRGGPVGDALDDRRLELLSRRAIDWAADLDAIEAEFARRRRRTRGRGPLAGAAAR